MLFWKYLPNILTRLDLYKLDAEQMISSFLNQSWLGTIMPSPYLYHMCTTILYRSYGHPSIPPWITDITSCLHITVGLNRVTMKTLNKWLCVIFVEHFCIIFGNYVSNSKWNIHRRLSWLRSADMVLYLNTRMSTMPITVNKFTGA